MSKNFKQVLLASLGVVSSLASANFVSASENKVTKPVKNENIKEPVKTVKPNNPEIKNEKGKGLSLILPILSTGVAGLTLGFVIKVGYDYLYGPSLEKYTIDNQLWQYILCTTLLCQGTIKA